MPRDYVAILFVGLVTLCSVTEQLSIDLTKASLADIVTAITNGRDSCEQIIKGYLDRIDRYNASIAGVISKNPLALQQARALDEEYKRTKKVRSFMHCGAVLVKDSIDVGGIPSTSGLSGLQKLVPSMDADVVANVKKHGAIILGKANQSPMSDKEAWGNSETGGLAKNPFGLKYTTYGSSGGNGAVIAARFATVSFGTEAGVSVNLPSSAANIVGLRVPVGSISLKGALPNVGFDDIIGPMTVKVEDVAKTTDAMMDKAQASLSSPSVLSEDGLRGMKINVFAKFAYEEFSFPGMGDYKLDPEVKKLFTTVVRNLVQAGAMVKNVSLNEAAAFSAFFAMKTFDSTMCTLGWRNAYLSDKTRFNASVPFHSTADVIKAKILPKRYQRRWEHELAVGNEKQCAEATVKHSKLKANLLENFGNPLLKDADFAIWPSMPIFPIVIPPEAYRREWDFETPMPINLNMLGAVTNYVGMTIPMGFSSPKDGAPDGLPMGAYLYAAPAKLSATIKGAYAYQKKFGITKVPRLVAA